MDRPLPDTGKADRIGVRYTRSRDHWQNTPGKEERTHYHFLPPYRSDNMMVMDMLDIHGRSERKSLGSLHVPS